MLHQAAENSTAKITSGSATNYPEKACFCNKNEKTRCCLRKNTYLRNYCYLCMVFGRMSFPDASVPQNYTK